jgi:predicted O-methyltransferase YrrM
MTAFAAAPYWDRRYATGGTSGAGSRGAEAEEKVRLVQRVIDEHGVRSVLDLGCGDGYVASRLRVAEYVGYDPAPSALALCRAAMPGRAFVGELPAGPFDLVLSLDVMFHLVDDADYREHIFWLLSLGSCALVWSTDHAERGAKHVLHRKWTADVPPGWAVTRIPTEHKSAYLLTRKTPGRAEDVEGLIPASTGQLLEKLARKVPEGQRVVEIGAYTGRSTAFLARGSAAGRCGLPVLSIDPHGMAGAEMGRGGRFAGEHVRATYLRNLADVGALPHVEAVRALSSRASLPREPIGLLWIDGDHSRAAVVEDVRRWAPLVAPGGFIVFDDYGTHHPGVNDVVHRMMKDPQWQDWLAFPKPLAWARRA